MKGFRIFDVVYGYKKDAVTEKEKHLEKLFTESPSFTIEMRKDRVWTAGGQQPEETGNTGQFLTGINDAVSPNSNKVTVLSFDSICDALDGMGYHVENISVLKKNAPYFIDFKSATEIVRRGLVIASDETDEELHLFQNVVDAAQEHAYKDLREHPSFRIDYPDTDFYREGYFFEGADMEDYLASKSPEIPVTVHETLAQAIVAVRKQLRPAQIIDRTKHVSILASLFTLANVSKSRRRGCAAALVRYIDGVPTIISSGVNGTPVNSENLCEDHGLAVSMENVIHAEINCVQRAEKILPTDILFVTDSPCQFCLESIRGYGVKHVVFSRDYRIISHIMEEKEISISYIPEQEVKDFIVSAVTRMDQVTS